MMPSAGKQAKTLEEWKDAIEASGSRAKQGMWNLSYHKEVEAPGGSPPFSGGSRGESALFHLGQLTIAALQEHLDRNRLVIVLRADGSVKVHLNYHSLLHHPPSAKSLIVNDGAGATAVAVAFTDTAVAFTDTAAVIYAWPFSATVVSFLVVCQPAVEAGLCPTPTVHMAFDVRCCQL